MIIRPMQLQDIPEVKNLIDSNFPRRISQDALTATLDSDGNYTYVMTSGSEIIATVGIRDNARLCWITSKYKRHGNVRAMLESLLMGMDYAYLKVKKDNYPAINLYTSLGFKATSEADTSYVMELKK